jgi:hypothetical protein
LIFQLLYVGLINILLLDELREMHIDCILYLVVRLNEVSMALPEIFNESFLGLSDYLFEALRGDVIVN